jgi:hypothetical protein
MPTHALPPCKLGVARTIGSPPLPPPPAPRAAQGPPRPSAALCLTRIGFGRFRLSLLHPGLPCPPTRSLRASWVSLAPLGAHRSRRRPRRAPRKAPLTRARPCASHALISVGSGFRCCIQASHAHPRAPSVQTGCRSHHWEPTAPAAARAARRARPPPPERGPAPKQHWIRSVPAFAAASRPPMPTHALPPCNWVSLAPLGAHRSRRRPRRAPRKAPPARARPCT